MQTALRAQSYAYDASSKVTSHTVDGVTTSYAYDGAGQLLTESRPGYSASYTYDGNGNRSTRTVNGVVEVYAYDDGDKLLSVSVGGSPVKTYGYDLAGRTTSVVSSSGTTTIAYDFEGRATAIVGPGVSQTNTYNGLDTRVGSTTNSVARTFLRDGAYVTDPVLKDGAAVYTPGVSERRGTAMMYLHSGLKNADAQSSALGALTGTRQYDAFGNVASSTGTWSGPFGYAGAFGYQEDGSGLRLLGHRLYDASTGRFLTRDPINDGRNWYVYCGNDPISRADPDGQFWILLVVAVAAVVLVGCGESPSSNPAPTPMPTPPLAGEAGGAMGGAPAAARIRIRQLEKEEAARDLMSGSQDGPSDTFDHTDSSWQNPKTYSNPERYIPGSPAP